MFRKFLGLLVVPSLALGMNNANFFIMRPDGMGQQVSFSINSNDVVGMSSTGTTYSEEKELNNCLGSIYSGLSQGLLDVTSLERFVKENKSYSNNKKMISSNFSDVVIKCVNKNEEKEVCTISGDQTVPTITIPQGNFIIKADNFGFYKTISCSVSQERIIFLKTLYEDDARYKTDIIEGIQPILAPFSRDLRKTLNGEGAERVILGHGVLSIIKNKVMKK